MLWWEYVLCVWFLLEIASLLWLGWETAHPARLVMTQQGELCMLYPGDPGYSEA